MYLKPKVHLEYIVWLLILGEWNDFLFTSP